MPIICEKEAGITMNQFIETYKKENNIDKVCYCGRLDPMARGKICLLNDDECKNMDKYNKCSKTYKFEIIFGISTDSDDPLGIIDEIHTINCIDKYIDIIKKYIKIGPFEQEFHSYSSKRIKGKPLWHYKKNNIDIDKPVHNVEIFNILYDDIKIYNVNSWIENIINIINKIDKKCDFRQDTIIKQYIEFKELNTIYSLPITITVSSGFYIRQLVNDIKKYINIPILTFDINRIDIKID
jgi:tRNA pseudouridine55 synthase